MKVELGTKFREHFPNFPEADKEKIAEFILHVERQGFDGLQGRNKASSDIHKDNPNYAKLMQKVKAYNLWHYHIGIPAYIQSTKGDLVSEYLLHYIRDGETIKIVDLDSHPPFVLPDDAYLI